MSCILPPRLLVLLCFQLLISTLFFEVRAEEQGVEAIVVEIDHYESDEVEAIASILDGLSELQKNPMPRQTTSQESQIRIIPERSRASQHFINQIAAMKKWGGLVRTYAVFSRSGDLLSLGHFSIEERQARGKSSFIVNALPLSGPLLKLVEDGLYSWHLVSPLLNLEALVVQQFQSTGIASGDHLAVRLILPTGALEINDDLLPVKPYLPYDVNIPSAKVRANMVDKGYSKIATFETSRFFFSKSESAQTKESLRKAAREGQARDNASAKFIVLEKPLVGRSLARSSMRWTDADVDFEGDRLRRTLDYWLPTIEDFPVQFGYEFFGTTVGQTLDDWEQERGIQGKMCGLNLSPELRLTQKIDTPYLPSSKRDLFFKSLRLSLNSTEGGNRYSVSVSESLMNEMFRRRVDMFPAETGGLDHSSSCRLNFD